MCQCLEAVVPAVVKAVPSENLAEECPIPPAPSDVCNEPQCTRGKRKAKANNKKDCPAKKIVGDGTLLPTTPVSWMSSKTEIFIR